MGYLDDEYQGLHNEPYPKAYVGPGKPELKPRKVAQGLLDSITPDAGTITRLARSVAGMVLGEQYRTPLPSPTPGEAAKAVADVTPVGPLIDAAGQARDLGHSIGSGDSYGAGVKTAGLVGTVLAALVPVGKAAQTVKAAGKVRGGILQEPHMAVDGTLGKSAPDVTFRGKQPHEFTPQDWGDFGRHYGVDTLGPKSEAEWQKSLVPMKTNSGRDFTVPGGIDSDAPFTYYDTLHMKAQGIDPTDLPPDVHQKIHMRMVKALQPGPEGATNTQILNHHLFGMISPNQPLTPNELALNRVAVKGPEDLKAWNDMAPDYAAEPKMSVKDRNLLSARIAPQLGVQGADRIGVGGVGGLGVSGSANYTALAHMTQKFRDNPDFFRLKMNDNTLGGMSDAEKWAAHVMRVQNEVTGLGSKTASLSSVWQNPTGAQISAIDRHMATRYYDEVFPNPEAKADFERKTVAFYNTTHPDAPVTSFSEMMSAPGGRDTFVEKALAYVDNAPTMKTRAAKTGEFNPRMPEVLKNTNWIGGEPTDMAVIGQPYQRALNANAREGTAQGLAIFPSQWMLWDRIRKRLEPHGVLHPGLEKLPRMSQSQAQGVRDAHADAGYLAPPDAEPNIKPVANPSRLGLFSAAPVAAGGAALLDRLRREEEERQGLLSR